MADFTPSHAAFGSVKHGVSPDRIARVENVRYAVPGSYTTGTEYPTLSEAVAAAEAACERLESAPYHTRQFVDRRVTLVYADGSGSADVVVDRIEAFVPPSLIGEA
jgi:hypothetical protein